MAVTSLKALPLRVETVNRKEKNKMIGESETAFGEGCTKLVILTKRAMQEGRHFRYDQ